MSAAELVDILLLNAIRAQVAEGDRAGAIERLEATIAESIEGDPQRTAALIEEIAGLYVDAGRQGEAGEALAILADLVARLDGATAPGLAKIHESAGSAYHRAGNLAAAITHYEHALAIDRRFHDCSAELLGAALIRLSQIHAEAGTAEEADRLLTLGRDADARCADPNFAQRGRGIVVERTFDRVTRDSYATIKVYYATDRARTGSQRLDDFYGGERGELDYGVLDVTVPRIHKAGAVEAPSLLRIEWSENPERHIVIMRIETMSAGDMLANMRQTLSERGSEDAFVFVHGYNVSFAQAAKRTAQIAYDINFEGIPILYSWPSRGSALSYVADEAVVRLGGRRLMSLLDDVSRRSGAKRIHLIAHSMGNRALADALELLAVGRTASGEDAPLFDQIIFTAPDEDAGLFANMLQRIQPIARRLTLYASENDVALAVSRRLHGAAPRAGQAGPDILIAEEIDSVDMTALGEDMLGHSYFASTTSALSDILWLFWRDTSPKLRCGMEEVATGRGRHWAFDPVKCDGAVALSALTLARTEGAAALHRARRMIALARNDPNALAEWRAITAMIRTILAR